MSQASLLLKLWDALQRRETTFGQVMELSAACGLDGRQVLADQLDSPSASRRQLNSSSPINLNYYHIARSCDKPSSARSPSQRARNCLPRAAVVVLLKEESTIYSVDAQKKLGYSSSRQSGLDIDGGSITKFFIMAAMMKLVVSPFPELGAAPSHFVSLLGYWPRKICSLLMRYTRIDHLSKSYRQRYSCIVSGGEL